MTELHYCTKTIYVICLLILFVYCWQAETKFSMSLSIPGHHTYILVRLFVLAISRCPSCNSCNTSALPWGGMTTREPQTMQLSNNESSAFLEWYGWRSELQSFGHPLLIIRYWRICAKCGSFRVHIFICWCVTGDSLRCSISKTNSGGVWVEGCSDGKCSWLSASAFHVLLFFWIWGCTYN